jgi:hypothetical protein
MSFSYEIRDHNHRDFVLSPFIRMVTVLDIAAVFLAVYWCSKLYQKRQRQNHLPPGPKGLPILGNSLQIPSSYPWEIYLEWGQRYSMCMYVRIRANSQAPKDSDVIHLTTPGTDIAVVNSLDAAVELLGESFLNESEPFPIQPQRRGLPSVLIGHGFP